MPNHALHLDSNRKSQPGCPDTPPQNLWLYKAFLSSAVINSALSVAQAKSLKGILHSISFTLILIYQNIVLASKHTQNPTGSHHFQQYPHTPSHPVLPWLCYLDSLLSIPTSNEPIHSDIRSSHPSAQHSPVASSSLTYA